ncbi:hypothetical protein Enr17x_57680 [Gimesia fumaroli]|uniref:Uncharacterized protein n=1 Tax=Gimesia fumaroli TaxID=2527976 RepID=A0A518IKS9_9PLAN|nr:hypothetical protein Enr17x_57680 [Gimesia fumaroli]
MNNKMNWFYFSVLIALLPVSCRLIIWIVLDNSIRIDAFSLVDLVAFGIVLHATSLNEINNIPVRKFTAEIRDWKSRNVNTATFFLVLYGLFISLGIMTEVKTVKMNEYILLYSTFALGLVSLILSYRIYQKTATI